jgi:hypothetical protein
MNTGNVWVALALLGIVIVQFLFIRQSERHLTAIRGMVTVLCDLTSRMRAYIVEVDERGGASFLVGPLQDAGKQEKKKREKAHVREEVL